MARAPRRAAFALGLAALALVARAGDRPDARAGSRVDVAVDEYRQGLRLHLDGPGAEASPAPRASPSPAAGARRAFDQAVDDYRRSLGLELRAAAPGDAPDAAACRLARERAEGAGLVPDAATAVRIALAVWEPLRQGGGPDARATLERDTWRVERGADRAWIRKADGAVVALRLASDHPAILR